LDTPRSSQRFWGRPYSLVNMMDTLEAVVTCPPSRKALLALRDAEKVG
jgi:hypothetical protein